METWDADKTTFKQENFDRALADAISNHWGHIITVTGFGGDHEGFILACARCEVETDWAMAVSRDIDLHEKLEFEKIDAAAPPF